MGLRSKLDVFGMTDAVYERTISRMGRRFKLDVVSTADTVSESPLLFRGAFRAIPNGDDSITVQGWVLGEGARVKSVELLDGDAVVGRSELKLPRPAIAERFGDRPEAATCGFKMILEAAEPGEGDLTVRAILEGETPAPMGSVHIRATRESRFRRLVERASRSEDVPAASR